MGLRGAPDSLLFSDHEHNPPTHCTDSPWLFPPAPSYPHLAYKTFASRFALHPDTPHSTPPTSTHAHTHAPILPTPRPSPTGPDRVPVLTHRLRLSFRAHPQAQTEFPCQAGTTYHIFWNAEYLPGRHGFTIDERCGSAAPAGCERAPPAAGGGGRMATGRELGHSGRDIGRMAMRRANARRG